MLYFVKTPQIVKRLFSKLIWDIPTDEKVLYLTFDDGPTPEITNWVLEQLNYYNAKATFFCIGKNVTNHPSILNDILENGHAIGNHTNSHLNNWKVSNKTYLTDVEHANNQLKQHQKPIKNQKKLFRPPYGKIKLKTTKKLQKKGYEIIMWDVLSADFDQSITPQQCLDNVLKNTTPGSIIVCHDSVKAFGNLKYTLPKVLEYFYKKGFEFKTLNA